MDNEESGEVPAAENEDLDTTPPNPASSAAAPASAPSQKKWEMPKPVFRRSSGYLPQGFAPAALGNEDTTEIPNAGAVAAAGPEEAPPAPIQASEIVVEPQPELPDETIPEAPGDPPAQEKKRSGAVRVVLLVIALLAIIGFAAVFLSVIWFLFLAPASDSSF
jgi:hypothetical protein